MQLITCEHPRKIYSKAMNEWLVVPCGKCELCRNAHASKWVERLQQESKCWKYTIFITLTYDEKNCPKMVLQDDCSMVNLSTGEYVDREFFIRLDKQSQKIVRKSKGIKYCDMYDVQLFVKRLRYYLYEKSKSSKDANGNALRTEDSTLRYFIAGEISPTGYRPHFHGLLFFNSDRFAKAIDELVFSCWKFGLTDSQAVQHDAAGYVARYSSGLSSLPLVFQAHPFKPKAIFSKHPPIGSLAHPAKEIREIFDKGLTSLQLPKGNEFVSIPLYTWLKNRLFPKLRGFALLSHEQRISMYALPKYMRFETWQEFVDWYDDTCLSFDFLRYKCVKDPCLPLSSLELTDKVIHPTYFYLASLYDRRNEKDPYHSVRSYFYIAKRVCTQASVFGISVREYVTKIENYYDNVEKTTLKNYFDEMSLQSEKYHFAAHFIFADELFVECYTKFESFSDVPWWMIQTVDGFGLDPFQFWFSADYRAQFDPRNLQEYRDYQSKVHKILMDEHKNKAKKEYLREHPECQII